MNKFVIASIAAMLPTTASAGPIELRCGEPPLDIMLDLEGKTMTVTSHDRVVNTNETGTHMEAGNITTINNSVVIATTSAPFENRYTFYRFEGKLDLQDADGVHQGYPMTCNRVLRPLF